MPRAACTHRLQPGAVWRSPQPAVPFFAQHVLDLALNLRTLLLAQDPEEAVPHLVDVGDLRAGALEVEVVGHLHLGLARGALPLLVDGQRDLVDLGGDFSQVLVQRLLRGELAEAADLALVVIGRLYTKCTRVCLKRRRDEPSISNFSLRWLTTVRTQHTPPVLWQCSLYSWIAFRCSGANLRAVSI